MRLTCRFKQADGVFEIAENAQWLVLQTDLCSADFLARLMQILTNKTVDKLYKIYKFYVLFSLFFLIMCYNKGRRKEFYLAFTGAVAAVRSFFNNRFSKRRYIMKKVIFVLLALLILAVFCGCTGENAGNNTGGINNKVEDPFVDTTEKPGVLSAETEQRIRFDYLKYLGFDYPIDRIRVTYLGSYDRYVAVFILPKRNSGIDSMAYQEIAGYIFCFSEGGEMIFVWNPDGNSEYSNFCELSEAYASNIITQNDVKNIHELYEARDKK